MQIAGYQPSAIAFMDEVECHRQPARMIPMSVRQHDSFDGAEIDAETCAIVLDCKLYRTRIEQYCVLGTVAAGRDHEREAAGGAAFARARPLPHAPSPPSKP